MVYSFFWIFAECLLLFFFFVRHLHTTRKTDSFDFRGNCWWRLIIIYLLLWTNNARTQSLLPFQFSIVWNSHLVVDASHSSRIQSKGRSFLMCRFSDSCLHNWDNKSHKYTESMVFTTFYFDMFFYLFNGEPCISCVFIYINVLSRKFGLYLVIV